MSFDENFVEYRFNTSDDFKNYIVDVLKKLFLNLNLKDLQQLTYCVCFIINIIGIKFGYRKNKINLINQFKQNNNRDILAVVNIILPYINDKNNFQLFKEIRSFQQLYKGKININEKRLDVNNYKYCNIQFSRINRILNVNEDIDQFFFDKKFSNNYNLEEIDYDFFHLYQSTILAVNTIEQIANKLYVNWLNVRPIGLDYKDSSLYKRSFKFDEENDNYYFESSGEKIKLNWWRIKYQGYNDDHIQFYSKENYSYMLYDGLFIGDIYNTLVNDYYLSIKNIKWLIFEYNIDNKVFSLIEILDKFLPIENMLKDKSWNDLDDKEQLKYDNQWKTFKILINNKSDFNKISFDIISKLILNFISFFENNYQNIDEAINDEEYIPIRNIKTDDDDSEEQDNFEYTLDSVQIAIEKLSSRHIYQYIFSCIIKFKSTIYYEKVFDDNLILKEGNINFYLTPKNFYNFGKSIYIKNQNERFDRLWSCLDYNDRDIFCQRLNENTNTQNWFNISKNLVRVYSYQRNDAIEHNKLIYKEIRKNLLDNIFFSLVKKGILSELIYQPNLTDEKITSDEYLKKNKIIKKNLESVLIKNKSNYEKYKNSYYFITRDKYKNLKPVYKTKFFNNKIKVEEQNFFKNLVERGDRWYTFYAMDWMCQIMFYNNFINNRVIFVTGSTGQGKSTQIPKLVMYSLIMIQYKYGKIVCTQPRIDPTVSNADTISSQLGVPIKKYSKTFEKEISTEEAFVQFKHSGEEHTSSIVPHFLRLQTDGSFFETLSKNVILKEKFKSNNLNEINKYSLNNIYDIVMVDEAHEHNSYMDLILTLMRNTLLYNNSIKLLIISATIDADEPTYRRYYRDVDDNFSFPFNQLNNYYEMDRINVDRRFHISPPGKTTQHKVKDIYYSPNNIDSPDENEKNGIDTVFNIVKNTSEGDILFFSITVPKIKNLCNIFNKKLPENVIALPFYAKMLNKYKKIVGNIDSKISELNIDKSDILDVFEGNITEEEAKKVNMGKYNRAIIVATNVAEASITIRSLQFVVDIGYQFNVSYDFGNSMNKLSTTKITESSRIQRRGRVGRTQDGTVFYMYKEDSRKYIKQQYNIGSEDLSDILYNLLTDNYYDQPFLSIDDNPITYLNSIQTNDQETKKIVDRVKVYNRSGYDKILKEQYIKNNTFFNIGNLAINNKFLYKKVNYDYKFISKFKNALTFTQNGFYFKDLLDLYGEFFIIHPFENEIKRELLSGRIIYDPLNKKNKQKYKIISPNKILHFYNKIETKRLTYDLNYINNVFKKNLLNIDKKLIKTSFGLEFNKIKREINNFELDILPYIYSRKYNIKYQVIAIISFLKNVENGLSDWYIKEDRKYDNDNIKFFKNIHGNDNSDFMTLLNIFNKFKSSFPKLKIFNKSFYTLHQKKNNSYSNDLKEFKKINNDIYKKKIKTLLKSSKFNSFLKYKRNNKLNKKDSEIEYLSQNVSIKKEIYEEIENLKEIRNWCELNYINYNTLIDRLKRFYNNIQSFRFYDETDYKNYYKFNKLKKQKKIYDEIDKYTLINNISSNIEDNIIKCFLNKFKTNISYKEKDKYTLINPFNSDSKKYDLSKLNFNNYQSTVKPIDWIFFYSIDNKDGLQMISNIKPEWIIEIAPEIYNPTNLIYKNNSAGLEIINNFNIINLQYLVKNENNNKNILKKKDLQDIEFLKKKLNKRKIFSDDYENKIKILANEKEGKINEVTSQINDIKNNSQINEDQKEIQIKNISKKLNNFKDKFNKKITNLKNKFITDKEYYFAIDNLNKQINFIKKNHEYDYYNKLFSFISDKIIKKQIGGFSKKNMLNNINISNMWQNNWLTLKRNIELNAGYYLNNYDVLLKVKIKQIKNTSQIMSNIPTKKHKLIDNYDYGYLHFQSNILVGIHLIKKKNLVATINVLFKMNNSTVDFIENHMINKGYSTVTILYNL